MSTSPTGASWAKKLSSHTIELIEGLDGDVASEKDVHQLRTTVRRLEVALETITPIRGMRRLQRELTKLRQCAGKVRDIDVQRNLLDSLDSNFEHDVQELHSHFRDRRSRHEQKLLKVVDHVVASGVKKRLQRLSLSSPTPTSISRPEIVAEVRDEYIRLSSHVPMDGEPLHDFRKSCKRLRYRLESVPGRDSRVLTQGLKQVQDSIGLWHDWLELSVTAEKSLKHISLPFRALLRSKITASRNDAIRGARELRDRLSSQSAQRKGPSKSSTNTRLTTKVVAAG